MVSDCNSIIEVAADRSLNLDQLRFGPVETPRLRAHVPAAVLPRGIVHSIPRQSAYRLKIQIHSSACALPFADSSFDHALSMLALQFVPLTSFAWRYCPGDAGTRPKPRRAPNKLLAVKGFDANATRS